MACTPARRRPALRKLQRAAAAAAADAEKRREEVEASVAQMRRKQNYAQSLLGAIEEAERQ
eukprot:4754367-Prymnesium_polylepis.1